MKKSVTALGLLFASANASALPLVDFWAGAYSWNTSYTGSVAATSNGAAFDLDMQDTLNLGDENNNVLWVAFEHPVPLLPNVQIKKTDLQATGEGSTNQSFTFADKTYEANITLNSDLNLNHTDFTAYWGLPLPIATVDFGLNVRVFDGDLTINDASSVLDAPVPMLFGRVGAELPFTGLAIMGEANYIGIGDTNHLDYQVVVRYTIPAIPVLDVNVEAGYRSFQLNIDPTDFDGDEGDLNADIDMSGIFLGVSLHL